MRSSVRRHRRLRSIVAPWVVVLGCAGPRATVTPTDEPDAAPPSNAEPGQPIVADEPVIAVPATDVSPAVANRPPKTIYRSELERALAGGPGYLLYQLAPEPYKLSGKFVGWEITKLFPSDPELCAPGCDLEIGDVILSVNGDRLETPQAFSDFLTKLPKMRSLDVRSLRNERRRVVKYAIVEEDA